jgi:hypothetical protein
MRENIMDWEIAYARWERRKKNMMNGEIAYASWERRRKTCKMKEEEENHHEKRSVQKWRDLRVTAREREKGWLGKKGRR